MDGMQDGNLIKDVAALRSLYGEPMEPAIAKEVDHVHPHYRAMIEASPFMVMATSGPDGLDVSPRGDPSGFVVVEDERTLLIPDRRGNNRTDSLSNLIADPRIGDQVAQAVGAIVAASVRDQQRPLILYHDEPRRIAARRDIQPVRSAGRHHHEWRRLDQD